MRFSFDESADILIVDDRPDGLIALEAVLSDPKIRIVKAYSGPEALKLLPQYEFAAILLDVQMPGMDGFETAERIRTMEPFKHIPIIFVTAINKDEGYVSKGYDQGAVDYILKPFNPHILKSKVRIFIDLFLQSRKIRLQEALLLQAERSERVRHLAELELESLRRYHNLADAIPHIVCRTKPDSTPEYFNRGWAEYTGLSAETSVGDGFQAAMHPEDLPGLMRTWLDALITGTSFEAETRIRRHDGVYRWHMIRACPERAHGNDVVAWIGTATDIDDRKRATEDLQRAKEEAESANIAKTQFLANMSHEIRTPLSAILGFSELLLSINLTSEERLENLAAIRRNGEQLLHLVNEILDISKVESGKIEIERLKIGVAAFLNELRLLFELKASERGLEFDIDCIEEIPAWIWTDPVRLRQIALNVVGNAIKFTEHGFVRVSLGFRADSGITGQMPKSGFLCLRVRDSGVGIERESLDRLFEPFMQADSSTTRRFGGTGLGLALSKRLARSLGGDVVLLSSQPGGSEFEIRIRCEIEGSETIERGPLRTAKQAAFTSEEKVSYSLSGRKILVVDDAPDNRLLISRFLAGAGAAVELAINGENGLEMATSRDYDLILMDLQMPEMDGYTTTQRLRELGLTCPIIALTAHALKTVHERCIASGFDGYLAKPIRRSHLVKAVSGWLESPTGADRARVLRGVSAHFY